MSAQFLARHCAATLAGLKTGTLFSLRYATQAELFCLLRDWNLRFRTKGLRILPLRWQEGRALIYLYRPQQLKEDFSDPNLRAILAPLGYCVDDPVCCLAQLWQRLRTQATFPHEIGLFLSYPPEDVRGFLEHRPAKMTGCWKVYGDIARAKRIFALYDACTCFFCRSLDAGVELSALIVSS